MPRYFQDFNLVEIQKTFYTIPNLKTVENWRRKAPGGFEFAVKAWQAISHPSDSPTWKRVKPPAVSGTEYGLLRPVKENFEAWEKTVEVCKTLGSKVAVIQTPPSFRCSDENYRNAFRFFEEASRAAVKIAWEPRGDWVENPDKISKICRKFGLIHVVDLLRRRPATVSGTYYTRLHGLNPREYDYKYAYSDGELGRLAETLTELRDQGVQEAYVLFNNLAMVKDASHFKDLVKHKGLL